MAILNYKLQGVETMSNPNLVFLIVQRISILYCSWHNTLQRQASNIYNEYVCINGLNCLVGNYATDNKLLPFKLFKNNTNMLTVQIRKLFVLMAFQIFVGTIFLSFIEHR